MRIKILLIGISAFLLFTESVFAQKSDSDKSVNATDFIHHVQPILNEAGCDAISCHGNQKNNLCLSMFSGNPQEDYKTITTGRTGRFINRVEPEKSLLIAKCNGTLKHDGGAVLSEMQSELLVHWITTGTAYDLNPNAKLRELQVVFDKESYIPGEEVKINVLALYTNGEQKDVTNECHIESNNDRIAKTTEDQKLVVNNFGMVSIMARYNYHFGVSELVVKQNIPSGLFKEKSTNPIDDYILGNLEKTGIPPSKICDDAGFLRRVYLNLTGRLPTVDQARNFLDDSASDKRRILIDNLLLSSEFVECLALKWGDLLRIKSEFPSNLWPNAVQAYDRKIKLMLRPEKGYDDFVKELLLSTGSNFRNPEVNYYRAFGERMSENIGDNTGLIFMGKRYECARCHPHPKEPMVLDKTSGLDHFFTQLSYKNTAEWKEEIVYIDKDKRPETKLVVMPDGEKVKLASGMDTRKSFVSWLVDSANPFFAKTMVNRIWFWLMGRGIVHEPDDFRITNPPSNPELLAYLENEFIKSDFDIRHIYRIILNSDTYQRSSETNKWNEKDETCFSHYQVRRLGAEQLIDALCDITGSPEFYMSKVPEPFTFLPEEQRAISLADGTMTTPFLKLFGRPSRNISYENDRNNTLTAQQILYVLNSEHLQQKINTGRIVSAAMEKPTQNETIEYLYLTILSRYPVKEEKDIIKEHWALSSPEMGKNVEDLIWALINTKAFIFDH